MWNDTEIVWGHGTSPQPHESCIKSQRGFGRQPTAQAACFFSLQSALGPPLPPSAYLKWWFWLQVSEHCLDRLQMEVQPHLLAWVQHAEVLLFRGYLSWTEDVVCPQTTLPAAAWASPASSPTHASLWPETAYIQKKNKSKTKTKVNQTTARISKSLRERAQGVDVSSCHSTVAWLLQQRADGAIWSREAVSKDITVSSCRHYRARRKANRWLETAQSDGSMALVPVYLDFARLSGCCHWCWRGNGVSGMVSPSRRCQALIWTAVSSHGSRRSCKSSSPGFPLQELLSQLCPSFPKCLCTIFAYAVAKPWAGSHPIRSCNSYQIQQTASQVPSLC